MDKREFSPVEMSFLSTALYEQARVILPTEENKIIVRSTCEKLGFHVTVTDYILADIGRDE